MTSTQTAMAMPTSAASGHDHSSMGHDHSSMGHDHSSMGGMGNGCKISMLFNLNTIDSCFLSSSWQITSNGMFAGSCIGVFLLGMVLEFLRRSIKEYDRFLVRQHLSKFQSATSPAAATNSSINSSKDGPVVAAAAASSCAAAAVPPFRPNLWQQGIRAFLHLLAFVVAYILMLLAMYYNGYMILCIFLGSFFGAFIFQWETLPLGGQQTSAAQESTVCCG
ncbi:Copper Transporter integral membrane protein that functions in high affinity copper transport [Metarhizium rileyi]|nr:Copper Transporter integral membrane protein that functions in high affinity copper transport [Metarhizium rileyi]